MVLVAGGVGITPMMSILRTAAQVGDRRPIRLMLTDRPGEGLFRPELEELAAKLELHVHELGRDLTTDRVDEVLPPGLVRNQQDYYICGPPSLVLDATNVLSTLDVPDGRIHTEQFNA